MVFLPPPPLMGGGLFKEVNFMYAVYNKKTGEECVLLHQVDVREMLESEEWSMQKPEENLVKRKTTKKVAEKTNG